MRSRRRSWSWCARPRTIRKRESIADWLHGVALRVSAHARADSARRRAVERRAGTGSSIAYETTPADRDVWDEVEHLPRDLRAVVVLCYLEGLTHEQAARRLGWPVGTVRSRLARARDRLRTRLTRRGLAPDTAFLPMLSFKASSLPQGLIDATVKAAMLVAARDAAEAGLVSTSAAALTEGVLRTMLFTKLKSAAATLLAAGAIASGVGLYAYQDPVPGAKPAVPMPPPAKAGTRVLSALDLDAFAAKMEELVRHARQAQAEGDIEGAREHVQRVEGFAAYWKETLTNARLQEKEDLSSRRMRPAAKSARSGPVPSRRPLRIGSARSGQCDPLPKSPIRGAPEPASAEDRLSSSRRMRPAAEKPDPGRPEPASAEDRLSRLERTVERLVSALGKDGQAELDRRDEPFPSREADLTASTCGGGGGAEGRPPKPANRDQYRFRRRARRGPRADRFPP